MYTACKCEVCGEFCLGTEKPESCPFCGAHKLHLEPVDVDEFKSIFPDLDDLKSEEDMPLFIDLDHSDFPEISDDIVEKVKRRAKEYGVLEAYSIFRESVSEEVAGDFFRGLVELEE